MVLRLACEHEQGCVRQTSLRGPKEDVPGGTRGGPRGGSPKARKVQRYRILIKQLQTKNFGPALGEEGGRT